MKKHCSSRESYTLVKKSGVWFNGLSNIKYKNSNSAITLIALIITIIVLLILAGVTLTMVIGESGIIHKAQESKDETLKSTALEDIKLRVLEVNTDKEGKATLEDIIGFFEENSDVYTITKKESDRIYVINKNYKYEVEITAELQVSLTGKNNENELSANIIYDRGKVSTEAGGIVGANDINSAYKIESDHAYMEVTGTGGNNASYVGTKNKINLTGYGKIKCLVTTGDNAIYSGNYFVMVIGNNQLPSYVDISSFLATSEKIGNNKNEYILTFNIPDEYRTSDYYVGVLNCLKEAYVYKIWLEKPEVTTIYNYGKVSKDAGSLVGTNDRNSAYKIESEHAYMEVTGPGGFNGSYVGTEKKINLSGYAKIKCLVTTGDNATDSGNYFVMVIGNNQLPSYVAISSFLATSEKIGNNKNEYILTFNIPEAYKNEYYIGVFNCLKETYLYKIWLEKE